MKNTDGKLHSSEFRMISWLTVDGLMIVVPWVESRGSREILLPRFFPDAIPNGEGWVYDDATIDPAKFLTSIWSLMQIEGLAEETEPPPPTDNRGKPRKPCETA